MNLSKQLCLGLFVATVVGGLESGVLAQVVRSSDEASEFPQATLACKLRMGAITEKQSNSDFGKSCAATCAVISPLKGEVGVGIQITYDLGIDGRLRHDGHVLKAGEVYIVMLQGTSPPYRMFAAMPATDAVVEPTFGTKPGDRLLAELVAMCQSKDAAMRLEAIKQIGIMRDIRGSKVVNAAAQDEDTETAREAMIAQYRMKIAPDAKRLMKLFNEQVMDVWYQESGIPRKDAKGNDIWSDRGRFTVWERGLSDFDYAAYVREGIKNEWVRKDDHTLYVFFGVPWKVQRRQCVPELVKLLEDKDKKVRWWAVICLIHTVEGLHEHPAWEEYEKTEEQELKKWRKWWQENGKAFMAGVV